VERTLNENKEIEGDKFQCTCGNIEFQQDCYMKSIEKVHIVKRVSTDMLIVSIDMIPPGDEEVEYNNSFSCPKCGAEYYISKKDGTDIICKESEGNQNG